jgi:hypothetical protein
LPLSKADQILTRVGSRNFIFFEAILLIGENDVSRIVGWTGWQETTTM